MTTLDNPSFKDEWDFTWAIPCLWPECARSWIERCKKSEWLRKADIEKILENGCHVVPVAHKKTNGPESDIEWCFSFATTEVELANSILNDYQRHSYVFFKLFRRALIHKDKKFEVISSYHCKTVFLHACEILPETRWENPGWCFLYLLNRLLQHVKCRNLPTFFIPENNLFDVLTDEADAERILKEARKNPMLILLPFTDEYVLQDQSRRSAFREDIQPLIDNDNLKNIQTNKDNYMMVLEKVTWSCLMSLKTTEIARLLVDMYRHMKMFFENLSDFILSIIEKPTCMSPPTQYTLVFPVTMLVQSILVYAQNSQGTSGLQEYLALLYSSASMSYPIDSEKFKEIKEKTLTLYMKLERDKMSVQGHINYAIFLLRCNMKKEAKDVLDLFTITTGKNCQHQMNNYNVLTFNALPRLLMAHLSKTLFTNAFKQIQFPTVSLAYFVRILCYDEDDITSWNEYIVKFQNYCSADQYSSSHYLLGLLCETKEKFVEAEKAFIDSGNFLEAIEKAIICHVQCVIQSTSCNSAVQYIIKVWGKMFQHFPVEEVLVYLTLKARCPEKSVDMFKEISKRYPDFTKSRVNLAFMYLAYACSLPFENTDRITAFGNSKTEFNRLLTVGDKPPSGIIAGIGLLHFVQKEWHEGIEFLKKYIEHIDDDSENEFSISLLHALDEYLKNEIDIHGVFRCKSKAFCYYILGNSMVFWLKEKGRYSKNDTDKTTVLYLRKSKPSSAGQDKVEKNRDSAAEDIEKIEMDSTERNADREIHVDALLKDFENYCLEDFSATSFSLLGYLYMMKENWNTAVVWLCHAVCAEYLGKNFYKFKKKSKTAGELQEYIKSPQYKPDGLQNYTAAKQNITVCLERASNPVPLHKIIEECSIPVELIPEVFGDFTLESDKVGMIYLNNTDLKDPDPVEVVPNKN
ncbi:uncharacterized protein LOC134254876 [Saccostrea cucullata]|uniref:uncharacterized protein LOC134254876 n=1 Tax=Saccostrea cuccullata TaxID=36930 RepID=UPI002ED5D27E